MEEPTETLTPADVLANLIQMVNQHMKDSTEFYKKTVSELKSLQKDVKKIKSKKAPKDENSTRVSGFDIPVIVSEKLKTLLGLEEAEYSRKQITALVTKYVKENNLQNQENKRLIVLDSSDYGRKLADVLEPDQPLTFFNMQRYLSKHYTKKSVVTPSLHEVPIVDAPGLPSSPVDDLNGSSSPAMDGELVCGVVVTGDEVVDDDANKQRVVKKRSKKH
jgi:chromatin remodeling complex protein RSC6